MATDGSVGETLPPTSDAGERPSSANVTEPLVAPTPVPEAGGSSPSLLMSGADVEGSSRSPPAHGACLAPGSAQAAESGSSGRSLGAPQPHAQASTALAEAGTPSSAPQSTIEPTVLVAHLATPGTEERAPSREPAQSGGHGSEPRPSELTVAAMDSTLSAPTGRPELPVVGRLRAEQAPPGEWRNEAITRYLDQQVDESIQVLEAALETPSAVRRPVERLATMHLLVLEYVSRVTSPPAPEQAEVEKILAKAKELSDHAERITSNTGAISGLETFFAKGFRALAQFALRPSAEEELKRADFLFDAALKLDNSSPRALLGKAVVFSHVKEWGKALGNFRQVLRWAAPMAPRTGKRLRTLNELRFAIAACFCGLGRFEQTRQALSAIVASDPGDVESLCALAHLEAKLSKDGVGRSMEYLGEAANVEKEHPVVLCHLANHAFYCGFEDSAGAAKSGSPPASWELAEGLLRRAVAGSRSGHVQAEAHYQLGRLEHARGRYALAYEEYRKCYALHPEHHVCVFGLAQACVQQQKYQEAIPLLEVMQTVRGNMPEVLKLLCFAYMMVGDKAKEAVKCADTLVANNKEDVEAWAMRAEAHDQLAAEQPNVSATKVGTEAYEQVAKLLEGGDGAKKMASPQMWNNLGTLRGLQGDPDGAREAYSRGIELADKRLEGTQANPEEAKDLQVARLTMRFNRAWLAESLGDRPDFVQATQEYMAINEEHNGYADTLLRLGAQWQRVGEVEMAVQRYQDAMKTNPVLAALMQAQAHRLQAEYTKALQSAETAVRCAGEKQFHYAHVFLGNLYYEVASSEATKLSDRDVYMKKALWNFTRALEHEKDSHYAANGIGMVFAKRGKLDFAKRTFQSVMQHHAMAGDPSVYINLGHTYMCSGGDDTRKAVALYLRAIKMKPHDVSIRLYLAKAYFGLKEFDRCSSVLGDATQIWPDDLILRYNLAVAFESFGVHLVSMEKKTKRVVGVNSGMDQMTRAVELLAAASRLYSYVHERWGELNEQERKRLANSSGAPANILEEMKRVGMHKDYCADITARARDELANLSRTRMEMEARMNKISEDKAEKERSLKESQAVEKKKDEERRLEMEEQAIHIMDSTRDIVLGKNLGDLKESMKTKEKAMVKEKGLKGKDKAKKRNDVQMQPSGDGGGGDEPGLEGETDAMFNPGIDDEGDLQPKKDKKDRKAKKDKKDKKAKKNKKGKKEKKAKDRAKKKKEKKKEKKESDTAKEKKEKKAKKDEKKERDGHDRREKDKHEGKQRGNKQQGEEKAEAREHTDKDTARDYSKLEKGKATGKEPPILKPNKGSAKESRKRSREKSSASEQAEDKEQSSSPGGSSDDDKEEKESSVHEVESTSEANWECSDSGEEGA
mmetsp:Transcript_6724/g.18990  ORF Transcript_6724/g.18990 Transcript_6724/m.18990 type:complete len:1372 (+) Transcript_6724:148-4263(+)